MKQPEPQKPKKMGCKPRRKSETIPTHIGWYLIQALHPHKANVCTRMPPPFLFLHWPFSVDHHRNWIGGAFLVIDFALQNMERSFCIPQWIDLPATICHIHNYCPFGGDWRRGLVSLVEWNFALFCGERNKKKPQRRQSKWQMSEKEMVTKSFEYEIYSKQINFRFFKLLYSVQWLNRPSVRPFVRPSFCHFIHLKREGKIFTVKSLFCLLAFI